MYVFISHSRANSREALQLCEELRQRHVNTWLDVCHLEQGADWDQSVTSAIENADGFVFLIGPQGPTDRGQFFEWQQVVNREYHVDPTKPLIPVLIGQPEMPGFLKTRRWLFLSDTPDSYNEVARNIEIALKNPALCIDQEKLERGRREQQEALESLHRYAQALREEDMKRAGIRATE